MTRKSGHWYQDIDPCAFSRVLQSKFQIKSRYVNSSPRFQFILTLVFYSVWREPRSWEWQEGNSARSSRRCGDEKAASRRHSHFQRIRENAKKDAAEFASSKIGEFCRLPDHRGRRKTYNDEVRCFFQVWSHKNSSINAISNCQLLKKNGPFYQKKPLGVSNAPSHGLSQPTLLINRVNRQT